MSLSETGNDGDESPMDQSAVDDVEDSEHQDNDIEYNAKMGHDYSIKLCMSPSLESAEDALADLKLLLQPLQASGTGDKWPNLPLTLCQCLEWMKTFLWTFIDLTQKAKAKGIQSSHWMAASLGTANVAMKGKYFARKLRLWLKAYILNRGDLSVDQQGIGRISMIKHEDLAADLHLHLQTVGKYVKAGDIVEYLLDKGVQ